MIPPKNITFQEIPFGIVTIQKGQLDYLKTTRIRLRSKNSQIYFPIKGGKKYVQDNSDKYVFTLE